MNYLKVFRWELKDIIKGGDINVAVDFAAELITGGATGQTPRSLAAESGAEAGVGDGAVNADIGRQLSAQLRTFRGRGGMVRD